MKKIIGIIFCVLLFFGFAAVNSFAQQSNEQRITGRWADEDGDIWAFNANSTLVVEGETYRWYVNAYKMLIIDSEDDVALYCDFFITPDGRTLYLLQGDYDIFILRRR